MPDICDLILDDHDQLRRRFAALDETGLTRSRLEQVWGPLGVLLDLHAAAEEEIFYPALLADGHDAVDETADAIGDHNAIRDAVDAAGHQAVGSAEWWRAVGTARAQNSDHMAEEERGALADLRASTPTEARQALGAEFEAFKQRHAGGRQLDIQDQDPDSYIADKTP